MLGDLGDGDSLTDRRLLLYTLRRTEKILASNVYWNECDEHFVAIGPKVVIPVENPGWFGFQSDDGRQLLCQWSSVHEVADAQPKPQWILAHHPVTCRRYVQQIGDDDSVYEQVVVPAGSVLGVVDSGAKTMTRKRSRSRSRFPRAISRMMTSNKKSNNKRETSHCLKCLDSDGVELLLTSTEPAVFSQICKLDKLSLTCAYQLSDVVRRHQTPLVLKMAYGESPAAKCHFTGVVRLEEVYFEECIIACILDNTDNPVMFEIPTDSGIEFLVAKNSAQLMRENYLQKVIEYCHCSLEDYVVSMKVLHTFYSDGTEAVLDTTEHQPERSLPPLPSDSYSVVTATTVPTPSDDRPCQDSLYDTIRGMTRTTNSVHMREKYGTKGDAEEDDGGYLVPVQLLLPPGLTGTPDGRHRHDPLAAFVPVRAFTEQQHQQRGRRSRTDVPRPATPRLTARLSTPCFSAATLRDRSSRRSAHGTGYQPRSLGGSLSVIDTIGDGDSARYSTERLDSFLADSVDELRRLRIFQHCSPDGTEQEVRVYDDSGVEQDMTCLDTHQSVNDFLDKIFDGAASSPPTEEASHLSADMSNALFSDDFRCRGVTSSSLAHSATDSMLHSAVRRSLARRASSYHDSPGSSSSPCMWDPPYAQIPACRSNPPFERSSLGTRSSSRAADSGVELGIYSGCELGGLGGYSGSSSEAEPIYRKAGDWTPPQDVTSLSTCQVTASLRYIGLRERLVTHFRDEQVDGKQLAELNDALLREGFSEMNALERKKLVDFISGWRPKKC